MIQLKVYEGQSRTNQHYLDLYEQQPIKLNLSIEDITNAEAKSVFSRTFRVPATPANNLFFKHAFLVDGIDYDVTIKKPAEILVDGSEFRQGHVRLQRIFQNGAQDKIEYEIVFLGETRDFSSAIGDASLCQLTMTDLSHEVNAANIELSWEAYPQSQSLTAGLADGDVVYPLIDFGNNYDENGNPVDPDLGTPQARISTTGDTKFTSSSHPIDPTRMKPMIRARRIIGQIFDNAGYTFSSSFFDSSFFKQIYVSAFGNEASVSQDTGSSINTMSAEDTSAQGEGKLIIQQTITDPGNNYNTLSQYTAPSTGQYFMDAECYYAGEGGQSPPFQDLYGRLTIYNTTTNTAMVTGAYGHQQIIDVQGIVNLTIGDVIEIRCELEPNIPVEGVIVRNKEFNVLRAPGISLPNAQLDCEYKQIDFVKDILTTFRLVMAPDPGDSKNFIIEPFVNYIASGDVYDWSHKLMKDKDFIIEPLFNTQSDQIIFNHKEDGDWLNLYHTQAYKNVFGYLEFDSGNELLKGKRDVKTLWAPTPITQIEGAADTSSFIIPQLHTHSASDSGLLHNPIKPKTRLLFYNGLQSTNGGGHQHNWYLDGSPGNQTNGSWSLYPLVSYYNEWPMDQDTSVLNWNVDRPYWGQNVAGIDGLVTSQDLYTIYWSSYVQSLYNKDARRITAYFTLNNVDLQNFSFDDVIFVNGAYYRPEKINDAQIGKTGPVKCQLIKLLDYKPLSRVDGDLTYTVTEAGPGCYNGSDGTATFTFSGDFTTPISWSSTSGQSGQFTTNPGTISGLSPGQYTITLQDAQGRTATEIIVIPQSTATELTATNTIVVQTDCSTADGSLTVVASGGTSPYSILFDDGSTSFTRTNLSSSYYPYTITDANGCTFESNPLVSCETLVPPSHYSNVYTGIIGGLCQGETVGDDTDVTLVVIDSGNTPAESTDGYYAFDGSYQDMLLEYPSGVIVMDQTNGCDYPDNLWFYSPTSIYDAAEALFDCYCSHTNGYLDVATVNNGFNGLTIIVEE